MLQSSPRLQDETRTPRRARYGIDARLLIGIGLVVVSVVGVAAVVLASDARTTVYAASRTLVPGDVIGPADLVSRAVALDGAEDEYIAAGDLPDDGLVVTRPVRAGELVPIASLGRATALDSTAIVLDLAAPVSAAVEPGVLVDVWTATPAGRTDRDATAAPPAVLVSDAVVVRLVEDDSFVSGGGSRLEVLVPRSRVARVLQAVADEVALAAVPAGIPWDGR